MSTPDRAEVVRWMVETGNGPAAAIEHFGLDVDPRTVRIWRKKFGAEAAAPPEPEPEPADDQADDPDPERATRDQALAFLAIKGRTPGDTAAQFGVSQAQVRAWVLAWIAEGERTTEDAAEHFGLKAGKIRQWQARARRPQVSATADFQEGADGSLLASYYNFCQIVQHDPWWKDRMRWDDFASVARIRPGAGDEWVPLADRHERDATLYMAAEWKVNFPANIVHEGMVWWAEQHRVHPVRRYLQALRWDGRERLHKLFDLLGCERDALSDELARKWAISAVARVMQPGCKVDTVLVLAGAQGLRKSSAFRALAGADWFSDAALDITRPADAAMLIQGRWLYELAELDALSRSEASAVKAFITRETDTFRAPYGRNPESHARQGLLVGTTNDAAFLVDGTGHRRFWVRRVVGPVHLEQLVRERDNLWAEAVHRYREGLGRPFHWWLTPEEEELAAHTAAQFAAHDPWDAPVAFWLAEQGPSAKVTTEEVLRAAIGVPVERQKSAEVKRVAGVLTRLGWRRTRARMDAAGRIRPTVWVSGASSEPD